MIPIHQTTFGGPDSDQIGNCFATCIASILELPLEEVPNFCAATHWRAAMNAWLKLRGQFYMDVNLPGDLRDDLVSDWGYHVMSGEGPRGLRHSVVGYQGKMVHDPHPSGAGLLDEPDEYGFVVGRNPAIIVDPVHFRYMMLPGDQVHVRPPRGDRG